MPPRYRLSAAILVGVAIAVAAVYAVPAQPFRALLTAPLALILPGLAIMRCAAPAGALGVEFIALSIGLSLALDVLFGIALGAFGLIDATGWACALAGVTLAACIVELALHAPEPRRIKQSFAAPRLGKSLGAGLALGAAAALCFLALDMARSGATAQRDYSFTEFWMVPSEPAERNVVTIGVKNEEAAAQDYEIAIVAGGSTIGRWPTVKLGPGAEWTTEFAFPPEVAKATRLEAWLYRSDFPGRVYRKVWLAPSQS